jgi:hypothetical protein
MESNRKNPENTLNENNKPIETDSAEIVRRHLEDENHEITDEDIRNVKVITGNESPISGEEARLRTGEDNEKKESEDENDEDTDPNAKPATPWDVLSD